MTRKPKNWYETGYLTDWNKTEYDLPDTSKGLPTFWAVLFVMVASVGLWTLVLWLGSMLLHGGK